MAAHPDPELWATLPDAERLLSNILADPRGNHVVAVEKQSIGILCDAHVAGRSYELSKVCRSEPCSPKASLEMPVQRFIPSSTTCSAVRT
jgi:hypothetical protein